MALSCPMIRRWRNRPLLGPCFGLLLVLLASSWIVTAAPAHAEGPRAGAWELTAKGGASYFSTSRSFAPEHMIKPAVRIEALYGLHPLLDLGVEIAGVATDQQSYALASLSLSARLNIVHTESIVVGLSVGAGVSTGPPILADDLQASAPVSGYIRFGASLRGLLLDGMLVLGLDVGAEQLGVITGVAVVGVRLGQD